MASDNGWEPLSKPPRRRGAGAFVIAPFTRLARTHAGAMAGDALIAIALANSLFFDIDPDAARSKVALYLALTMAPFAVVAPLIGPALDRARGGRRLVVIGSNALRALICVMMVGDLDSMLLFPEAFAVLVLAKSYHVAKSAIVPTVVRSDAELVEANSRLSLLSNVVGFVAVIPGGLAFLVAGSEGVLVLAVVVFAVAAVMALRIPATQVVVDDTSETERGELRGGGIVLAASAMGLMRGIVGFLTFLVAFSLRTSGAPTYQFAVVIAASGIGSLLGTFVAPALRRNDTAEERIVQIVLGLTGAAGVLGAWAGGIVAAAALAMVVGISASSAKLAFDSVVQRDAPDANRGRSFARFETRFQLTWVVGAFLPVVVPIPLEIGFLVIAGCAVFALVSYLAGLRGLERGKMPVRRNPTQVITSRIRRRRQGFAVDPGTAGSPSPALASFDAGDDASPTATDEAGTDDPAVAGAGAHGRRPPPPALFSDDAVDDAVGGAGEPDTTDDAGAADRRHDRRVVIDPTNLQ